MRFSNNFDDPDDLYKEDFDFLDDDFEKPQRETKRAKAKKQRKKYRDIDDLIEEKRLKKNLYDDLDEYYMNDDLYDR